MHKHDPVRNIKGYIIKMIVVAYCALRRQYCFYITSSPIPKSVIGLASSKMLSIPHALPFATHYKKLRRQMDFLTQVTKFPLRFGVPVGLFFVQHESNRNCIHLSGRADGFEAAADLPSVSQGPALGLIVR